MADADLGRMLLASFRAFEAEVAEALEERQLTDVRSSFVTVLVNMDAEGTRLSDLARRANVTKQAMAEVVEQMEGLGLARRSDDPTDARARLVVLTAKGRRRLSQARRTIERVEARLRRRLGERRFEALRSTLLELTEGEE